jgi:hypothetical protein
MISKPINFIISFCYTCCLKGAAYFWGVWYLHQWTALFARRVWSISTIDGTTTLSRTSISITTLSIMGFFMTPSITALSAFMLSVLMVSILFFCYVGCHHAECGNAECHYTGCLGTAYISNGSRLPNAY